MSGKLKWKAACYGKKGCCDDGNDLFLFKPFHCCKIERRHRQDFDRFKPFFSNDKLHFVEIYRKNKAQILHVFVWVQI